MITDYIPKEPTLRWAWVKYQLELRGYTIAKLAMEMGTTRASVAVVKNKHYPKKQKAIADKLLMLPQEIWPERYGSDGKPIKHSPRYPRNDSTNNSKRQRIASGRE